MFGKIAAFEFRYQLKNPVFWVAVAIFFLLTFASVVVDVIRIGGGGNIHKNSPFSIVLTQMILTLFYMFVTTAFVSNVVVRDDETGYGGILRSTRVRRFDYLYGRFLGAFGVSALGYLAVPLAFVIGSVMPWMDKETLGPLTLEPFLVGYFVFALPNILLTSAVFFALATVTRSMMWTYVGVIGFLVLYTVFNIATDRPELEPVVAPWDPMGFGAFGVISKFWTISERNTLTPAVLGIVLENRLFVLGLAAAFLLLPLALFRFSPSATSAKRRKAERLAAVVKPADQKRVAKPLGRLPKARFDFGAAMAQLRIRTALDFGQVFGSPAYPVLLAIGLFNAVGSLWLATDNTGYGGQIYPLTRVMIPALMGSFVFIPLIISIYYAGELVWREREKKTHELIDSAPIPDWAFVVPKALAIILVLFSTLLISALGAIAIQAIKGAPDISLDKWLVWYLLPNTADMAIMAALAVFIQAVSPHKFVGWAIMLLYVAASFATGPMGLDHILYNYGTVPSDGGFGTPLSDMNGLGDFWKGAWIARAYWGFVALVLLILSHLLWRRGTETRLWPRIARMPRRLMGASGPVFLAALFGAVALGVFIYLNTNVWNPYRNNLDQQKWQADFERVLLNERQFDKVPQPKIVAMTTNIRLWPHEPRMVAVVDYVIENKTDKALKEIHLQFDRDLKVGPVSIEGARPKETLAEFNYRIYAFDTPMGPGERRKMTVTTVRSQRGFKNSGNERRISDNGTFIDSSEFAPTLGVWGPGPLQDPADRRRWLKGDAAKLKERPAPGDPASSQYNYLRHDADFVTSDITIQTDADQIAIAPGNKVSDVVKDGRRTARFVTSAPVLPFFSIQSARYAVARETWKGKELEVYYHPGHPWNVKRMTDAMKASLDYFETNFSPYQFGYSRFIEFPDYAQFAQAFAGTMPWSEGLFFISDYRDPEKIDMVTYVGAHEIGHQWWAHQVVGADQQGVTLMSETLAQYSALMVMKRMYGEEQIRKFLKYELNSYLRARGGQALEERPLVFVDPSQGYVHYRKGSLVMYRLAEEIGEEKVNAALRKFLSRFAFKGAPYPNSRDLIALFRAEAGPEHQQLITDLFEKITLYDLKVVRSKVTARKDGKFDVSLTVAARKMYATGKGVETDAPLAEMIDIGLFTEMPGRKGFGKASVQVMRRERIRTGEQTFTFTLDKRPTWVGIDPYNKLIDRNSDDNLLPAGQGAARQ